MTTTKTIDYDNLIHLRHDILYHGESQHFSTLLLDGTGKCCCIQIIFSLLIYRAVSFCYNLGDDIDYNEIANRLNKNESLDHVSLVNVFENLNTSKPKKVFASDILLKYSAKLLNSSI